MVITYLIAIIYLIAITYLIAIAYLTHPKKKILEIGIISYSPNTRSYNIYILYYIFRQYRFLFNTGIFRYLGFLIIKFIYIEY